MKAKSHAAEKYEDLLFDLFELYLLIISILQFKRYQKGILKVSKSMYGISTISLYRLKRYFF